MTAANRVLDLSLEPRTVLGSRCGHTDTNTVSVTVSDSKTESVNLTTAVRDGDGDRVRVGVLHQEPGLARAFQFRSRTHPCTRCPSPVITDKDGSGRQKTTFIDCRTRHRSARFHGRCAAKHAKRFSQLPETLLRNLQFCGSLPE